MSNKKATLYRIIIIQLLVMMPMVTFSQAILTADGPGNTYELINSILAPGAVAEETPDSFDPAFGRHIAEIWDADLGRYVFEFYVHVSVANEFQDISTGDTDRQRCEIKTYASSPDSLKGTYRETIVYKWKFKIPTGFQPSPNFTHIHQIKAVGGADSDPIFTLTVRKATPNRIELIHNNTTKVASANLSLFENTWVEATETIKIDSIHGSYSMDIKKVSDGTSIISYSNNDLMTIRSSNTFIRPKWGIYRSLLSSADLRDETLRFNDFSIYEVPGPKSQDISFPTLPVKMLNDTDFLPGATANSGLTVSYSSSNTAVATIVNNKIHINGLGITNITAYQAGNSKFYPANNVSQQLAVGNLKLTLYSVEDSYVYGANSTGNFGTATSLQIKENGTASYSRKSYCKFDLNGSALASILSASVRFYCNSITAGTVTPITITSCSDNWTETEITYENIPVNIDNLGTLNIDAASSWFNLNITPYCQTSLTKGNAISLLMADNGLTNTMTKFNSREATGEWPELVIAGIAKSNAIGKLQVNNDFHFKLSPISKNLYIEFTFPNSGNFRISLFSLNGQKIREYSYQHNEGLLQKAVDLSNLTSGVYLMQFNTENYMKTSKIIL